MAKPPPPRRGRRLPDEPQIPNEEIRYAMGESVLGPVLARVIDPIGRAGRGVLNRLARTGGG